ncbi:Macrolide export ATP-binding/permease protein MacB [Chitinispirillum alkaliphilum]|nr:Macrolide export ATP-binding/permease protein MacB [Chitinispirillum alkaliphilum]
MNLSKVRSLVFVNFKLSLLELSSNKTRSFITSLGIFLGVTSLLVNISFIRAMEENIRSNLNEIGGLSIVTVNQRSPVTLEERISFGRSPGLKIQNVEYAAKRFDYVRSVLPQQESRMRVNARGRRFWSRVTAISPDHFRVYNYQTGLGSEFTLADHHRGRPVCIIGRRIAQRLFGSHQSALGRKINIEGTPFEVVGIIHTDDDFSWRARQILIPYSSYVNRFSKPDATISEAAIELSSVDKVPRAIIEITQELKTIHRGVADFDITSNEVKIEEMRSASRGLKIILTSIAFISLLVGGISIMNIMFATIGDRIREIGVRKALGAKKADLFAQFIIEAVTFSFLGGILGIVAGTSITMLPADLFPIQPQLTIPDYLIAVTFTILTGLLSGLFPALRAASMQPVEALRY